MAEKKNEVAQTRKQGISSYLSSDAVKKNIVNVIGEKASVGFITSVVSATQVNPELSKCTNGSILSAALLGHTLNLAPSPQLGQFYMVPYKNTKTNTQEAQFQLGAKGYIQLAIRSGQYKRLVVSEIKEGELDFYNPITEEFKVTPITTGNRSNINTIGYYAMFELVNGFVKEIYWSKDEMQTHAKTYSSGYRSDLNKGTKYTFWSKNFDAMANKTMIRQLISKWGIMSIEMQSAFEKDMAVVQEDGTPVYVDNVQSTEENVEQDIKQNANTVDFDTEDENIIDVDEPNFA